MTGLTNPPQRCLVSDAPPSRPRDILVERLNPNSSGLLTGTRWPSFQPTVAGVGRRTWTVIWGPTFWLNYRHEPASKWPELKAKFFEFLINHHSEWKSIRNNDPLGYLPYMETQFERVTGYKLVGLGACTEWIRARSYYHWAIAQQGQLGRCPRLAGVPPPQGPMTPPPYPPVTAAASTQATVPDPPQGGGGRPRAESQPRKRDATTAGVQVAARSMGGAGDSSPRSGRGESREPRTMRSSSRKRRRSQSRRWDSRPTVPFPLQDHEGRLQAFGCCMKRPEKAGWPLR